MHRLVCLQCGEVPGIAHTLQALNKVLLVGLRWWKHAEVWHLSCTSVSACIWPCIPGDR